jgi:hypothetical protein
MRPSRRLVVTAVALGVLAMGLAGATLIRSGGPGLDDTALRVGGVEVTFAELALRREANVATRPVWERLRAGEAFGVPADIVSEFLGEQGDRAPDVATPEEQELKLIGTLVASAAARDVAAREGQTPSTAAVAARVEALSQGYEALRDEPTAMFMVATIDAQRAALGEERFLDEFLHLQAMDSLALEVLMAGVPHPAEGGIAPLTASMLVALDADLWIHPSLSVGVAELRSFLADEIARADDTGSD